VAKSYPCPILGCPETASYVGFSAEEVASTNSERLDPSAVVAVARNIIVECPVHGKRIIQKFGHHIDTPGPFRGAKVGGKWQSKKGRKKAGA